MNRIIFLPFCLTLLATPIKAQWSNDPDLNTPIAVWSGDQKGAKVITDGKKGSIVFWYDKRNGIDWDIYAQRMDSMGYAVWDSGGIPIVSTSGHQYDHRVVSDGKGGAFIVWMDYRNSNWDIFAQHMDSLGNLTWDTQGVPVAVLSGDQQYPSLVPDSLGGIFVVWEDERNGGTPDIYAQYISPIGVPLWQENGIPVCTAPNHQRRPKAILAPDGGIYVTWYDYRINLSQADIYMQRISPDGTPVWQENGIPVSTSPSDETGVRIISDGGTGAIVAWTSNDVYAQRVDSSGNLLWDTSGVVVCSEIGNQWGVELTPDGSGGTIITWIDERLGILNADIYAQRVSADGDLLWQSNGVQLTNAIGNQTMPVIVPDDSGGAFIVWQDNRNGAANSDIYAQHISPAGTILWNPSGQPVSTASSAQLFPYATNDGFGNLLVAWEDNRTSSDWNIYGQALKWDGNLGPPWTVQESKYTTNYLTILITGNKLILTLQNPAPPLRITILNPLGRVIFHKILSKSSKITLNPPLRKGIYYLLLRGENYRKSIRFLVIK